MANRRLPHISHAGAARRGFGPIGRSAATKVWSWKCYDTGTVESNRWVQSKWQTMLFVTNIENKVQMTGGPRVWGVRLSVSF